MCKYTIASYTNELNSKLKLWEVKKWFRNSKKTSYHGAIVYYKYIYTSYHGIHSLWHVKIDPSRN